MPLVNSCEPTDTLATAVSIQQTLWLAMMSDAEAKQQVLEDDEGPEIIAAAMEARLQIDWDSGAKAREEEK